jgi:hypothetical protein
MNDEMLKNWKKQITQIQDEVKELLRGKKIFIDTVKIIDKNKAIQKDLFTWWNYYKLNYTYFVVSKIWHQIDRDHRAGNLINLLHDLYENCSMISAEWWIGDGNDLSTDEFKKNFGGKTLTPSNVYADIGELMHITKDIKKIRHERIAHRNKSQMIKNTIALKNVEESIKIIEKLTKKYTLLLEQRNLDLNIRGGDDWQKSFSISWIS